GVYVIYLKAEPKDETTRVKAVALLDRIAKMRLGSPRLWQTVADDYRQLSESKKAETIYLKLLAESPEPSQLRESLHEKLAGLYFQTEDKTNAMRQLEA